jgi:hypothetical protein
VAGVCEDGNEPSCSIKKAGYFLISWVTISFSSNILHHGVSKHSTLYSLRNGNSERFFVVCVFKEHQASGKEHMGVVVYRYNRHRETIVHLPDGESVAEDAPRMEDT